MKNFWRGFEKRGNALKGIKSFAKKHLDFKEDFVVPSIMGGGVLAAGGVYHAMKNQPKKATMEKKANTLEDKRKNDLKPTRKPHKPYVKDFGIDHHKWSPKSMVAALGLGGRSTLPAVFIRGVKKHAGLKDKATKALIELTPKGKDVFKRVTGFKWNEKFAPNIKKQRQILRDQMIEMQMKYFEEMKFRPDDPRLH